MKDDSGLRNLACLDIGGSLIKAGLFKAPGDQVSVHKTATPGEDFGAFLVAVEQLLEELDAPYQALSISLTGVIDPVSGRLKCANIPCLDERSLGAELEQHLGMPVSLANDADCFALAEA